VQCSISSLLLNDLVCAQVDGDPIFSIAERCCSGYWRRTRSVPRRHKNDFHGKFVAYYRVSTDRQGKSGLGLEAQRGAVASYLNGGDWQIVSEFTDVESGKRADRPHSYRLTIIVEMMETHKQFQFGRSASIDQTASGVGKPEYY
jgi:hypothetical protein